MKTYPWRKALLACGILALVACLLVGLLALTAVALLLWS